jgi:hypothetical protein
MAGETANADAATSAKMNFMMIPPMATGSALGREIRVANVSADFGVTKMLRANAHAAHTEKRLRQNRCWKATDWI